MAKRSMLSIALGAVMSMLVQRTSNGKITFAALPAIILLFIALTAGCRTQHDEPFSACMRTVIGSILEVLNASSTGVTALGG